MPEQPNGMDSASAVASPSSLLTPMGWTEHDLQYFPIVQSLTNMIQPTGVFHPHYNKIFLASQCVTHENKSSHVKQPKFFRSTADWGQFFLLARK